MINKIKILTLVTISTSVLLISSFSNKSNNDNIDIAKVFHKFEITQERLGKNLSDDNQRLLAIIDKETEIQREYSKLWRDQAYEVKQITDEFVKYIDNIKLELLKEYGGRDSSNGGQLNDGANTKASSMYFLNPKDNQAKGRELMGKINMARIMITRYFLLEDRQKVRTDLYANDSDETKIQTWLSENFNELLLAAIFVTLTKYQNDALKTANDVIGIQISNIYKRSYKYDALSAMISAPCNTVKKGQPYTAEIFLGAWNTRRRSDVFVDGKRIDKFKDGSGIYKGETNTLGVHKYRVEIEVPDPITGVIGFFHAYGEYNVIN